MTVRPPEGVHPPEGTVVTMTHDLLRYQLTFELSSNPEARLVVDDVVSHDPYWLEEKVVKWIRQVAEYEHWDQRVENGDS